MIRTKPPSLSRQIKQKIAGHAISKRRSEYDGNTERTISTGSTLLDLAISGGRKRGGGLPGGIIVEIFGAPGSGKTVLLCEIGGAIQRDGGEARFFDPEGRLNEQFASMFGIKINDKNHIKPKTVTQIFQNISKWRLKPESEAINGILADSLTALSTDMEMEKEEGDKMGSRRAKEFSEGFRKTSLILSEKNSIMICSNQIRDTMAPFGPQWESPGGWAIKHYASLRLQIKVVHRLTREITYKKKAIKKVIGVQSEIEVVKSSIWKPHNKATLTILFDYGIDDIRENLQFVKNNTENAVYTVRGHNLDNSMDKSIRIVERDGLVKDLREETIDIWEDIESKFESDREPKIR